MLIENKQDLSPKVLSENDFKQVVKNAPLFAIDLVVINHKNEVLVGERTNAPAKNFWFVPGGRVYKNETLEGAFSRISKEELGKCFKQSEAHFLGLYEHFYQESFYDDNVSTHYINSTYAVKLLDDDVLKLPTQQHKQYRWVLFDKIEQEESIHHYSKVFLSGLTPLMTQDIREK